MVLVSFVSDSVISSHKSLNVGKQIKDLSIRVSSGLSTLGSAAPDTCDLTVRSKCFLYIKHAAYGAYRDWICGTDKPFLQWKAKQTKE